MQLVLWDTTSALNAVTKKRNRSQRGVHAQHDDENDDEKIPPVMPQSVSHIDSSHKRPVAEVMWLPPSIQVRNGSPHSGVLLGSFWLPRHSFNRMVSRSTSVGRC